MTNARALVYGGNFTGADFPKVNVQYTTPMQYAQYDWAADGLPLGPLETWVSLTGNASLPATSGSPTVINSGGGRAVMFDGVDDQMRLAYTKNSPYTIAAVFRFVAPQAGESVLYGYGGPSSGSIMIHPTSMSIIGNSLSGGFHMSPVLVPDTNWHVALLTVDGANSVLRVDGREAVGTLPTTARDGINIGYGNGTPTAKANVEYKRIVQFLGAGSAGTRDSIVNTLASRYGIPQ